jgi:hypothetical protein
MQGTGQTLESLNCINKCHVKADVFESIKSSLPNLTDLTLIDFDPARDLNLEKCPHLKSLAISSDSGRCLMKIPALVNMNRLTKLKFANITVTSDSVVGFDRLAALHSLEFRRCNMKCNWFQLGNALAQTPLQSLSIRFVKISVAKIQFLLDSMKLDHLFIAFERWRSREELQLYADVFASLRNPRSFLIQQDNDIQNLNGVSIG